MSSGLSFQFWKRARCRQPSLCKQHVSIPVLCLPSGRSTLLRFSTSVSFSPNQTARWPTFCHLLPLFVPASLPSSVSQPQLTSPGAGLLLVCDSHLLLVCPSRGTISPHTWGHQEKEEQEPLCTRDCLLQLSAAALLAGEGLVVMPEVTLLWEEVQTQFGHVEDLWWKGTLQSTQSCWTPSQSLSTWCSPHKIKVSQILLWHKVFLRTAKDSRTTQMHFKPSLWSTRKRLEIDSKMTFKLFSK